MSRAYSPSRPLFALLFALRADALDAAPLAGPSHVAADVTCPAFDPIALPVTTTALDPTPSVGSLQGVFSVSSTGEALYTIPLIVPPGRAGMEPKLALTYDSASGEGPFGLGFTLSGLSAVTRLGLPTSASQRNGEPSQ